MILPKTYEASRFWDFQDGKLARNAWGKGEALKPLERVLLPNGESKMSKNMPFSNWSIRLSGACRFRTKLQFQTFCNFETICQICNSLFLKGQHPSPTSAAHAVKSGLVWKMGLVESKGHWQFPGANQLVHFRVQGPSSCYIVEPRGQQAGTLSSPGVNQLLNCWVQVSTSCYIVESRGQPAVTLLSAAGYIGESRGQPAGTFSSSGDNQLVNYRVQGQTSWYIFESRGQPAGKFSSPGANQPVHCRMSSAGTNQLVHCQIQGQSAGTRVQTSFTKLKINLSSCTYS